MNFNIVEIFAVPLNIIRLFQSQNEAIDIIDNFFQV